MKRSWESKLPAEIDAKCLIFHGAPDIIIHNKKGEREEGILVANNEEAEDAPIAMKVEQCRWATR